MNPSNSVDTCANCGLSLRRGAKRKGSLTAWMFADMSCKCSTPRLTFIDESTKDAGQSGDLAAGVLIQGRYKILGLIGRGGMGNVYKAEDVNDGKLYALKTLHADQTSEQAWRRFQKEAQAASVLDHPTLVKVHALGTLNQRQPFFIMDYVDGRTLAQRLKESGPLSIDQALDIFIQLSSGLAYAHRNSVIHRDLKPSNILLVESDESTELVKIVDFGIAKLLDDIESDTEQLTRTGDTFGTPFYMSPEQCLGARVDHRSDIYSLGCVLYESLTGMPPFLGSGALTILLKHQSEKPAPLKEASLGREFPEAIQKVIDRLLEKTPEARYQDLDSVNEDLRRIKAGEPLLNTSELIQRRAPSSNKVAGGASLAAIAGLILIACAFWLCRSGQETKAPPTVRAEDTAGGAPQILPPDAELEPMINRGPDRAKLWYLAKNQAASIDCKVDGKPFTLTDSDLDVLAMDKKLKTLDLSGIAISGAGLDKLKGLPIEKLNLNGTLTNDAGLMNVRMLPALRSISLDETKVSDSGVDVLASMPALTSVSLKGCPDISLEALVRLSGKLPKCSITPDPNTEIDRMIEAARNSIKSKSFQSGLDSCEKIVKLLDDQTVSKNGNDARKGSQLFCASCYAAVCCEQLLKSEEAESYYSKALSQQHELVLDSAALIDPLLALAGHYREKEQYKTADELYQKASRILNVSKSPAASKLKGDVLMNAGWNYMLMHDYAKSDSFIKKALSEYKKDGGSHSLGVGVCMFQLGRLDYMAGRLLEAQSKLRQSISILDEHVVDPESRQWSIMALQQLAEVDAKQGRLDDAQKDLETAFSESDEIMPAAKRAVILERLIKICKDEKKSAEAKLYTLQLSNLKRK